MGLYASSLLWGMSTNRDENIESGVGKRGFRTGDSKGWELRKPEEKKVVVLEVKVGIEQPL